MLGSLWKCSYTMTSFLTLGDGLVGVETGPQSCDNLAPQASQLLGSHDHTQEPPRLAAVFCLLRGMLGRGADTPETAWL